MNEKKYDYFIMNLKGILIFLVVFAHSLELLNMNGLPKILYLFIYSFHMPLFVFTYGVFAKYDLKKITKNIIIPFFILQLIYSLINNNFLIFLAVLFPYHFLWFLVSALWWSSLLPILEKISIKSKYWIFAFSIIMALFVGYIEEINYMFSLSRTFVFSPFFILGNIYIEEKTKWLQHFNKFVNTYKFLLTTLVVFVFSLIIIFEKQLQSDWFYGAKSYYETNSTIIHRLLYLLIPFVFLCLFLCFIPKKEIKWISFLGKNTWPIFCFHEIFIIFMAKKKLINKLSILPFSQNIVVIIAIILLFICSIIITFVLTRKVFIWFSNMIRFKF